jgi:hypothetical protein
MTIRKVLLLAILVALAAAVVDADKRTVQKEREQLEKERRKQSIREQKRIRDAKLSQAKTKGETNADDDLREHDMLQGNDHLGGSPSLMELDQEAVMLDMLDAHMGELPEEIQMHLAHMKLLHAEAEKLGGGIEGLPFPLREQLEAATRYTVISPDEFESNSVFTPNSMYPWSSDGFEDHNHALLQEMRKVMVLDVSEESLPPPLVLAHNQQEIQRRRKIESGSDVEGTLDFELEEGAFIDDVSVEDLLNRTAVMVDADANQYYLNVLLPSAEGKEDLYDTATDFQRTRAEYLRREEERKRHADAESRLTNTKTKGGQVGAAASGPGKSSRGPAAGDSGEGPLLDHNLYNERLEGVCMILPTGYWSYEICHAKEVRQLHFEHDPARPEKGTYPTNLKSCGRIKRAGDTPADAVIREVHRVVSPQKLQKMVKAGKDTDTDTDSGAGASVVEMTSYTAGDRDHRTGVYNRVGEDEGERILRITDYYRAGDRCEAEDGHKAVPRSSVVVTQCCSSPMALEQALPVPEGVPDTVWHQLQELLRLENPAEDGKSGGGDDDGAVYTPEGVRVSDRREEDEEAVIQQVARLFQNQAGEGELTSEQARALASAHIAELHEAKVAAAAAGGLDPSLQPASVMRSSEANKYRHDLVLRHGQHQDQPGAASKGYPLDKAGHVGAFVESSRCQYHFVVCAPQLCMGEDEGEDEATSERERGREMERQRQEEERQQQAPKKQKKKGKKSKKSKKDKDKKKKKDKARRDEGDDWGQDVWEAQVEGDGVGSLSHEVSPAVDATGTDTGSHMPSATPTATPPPSVTPTSSIHEIAGDTPSKGKGKDRKYKGGNSDAAGGSSSKKRRRDKSASSAKAAAAAASDQDAESYWSLSQVMEAITNLCLVRQEEWWTYELCFKHGVRQFHLQTEAASASGSKSGQAGQQQNQQMVITSEFNLGNAPVTSYTSEEELNRQVSGGDRRKMMARVNEGHSGGGEEAGRDRSEKEFLIAAATHDYHYGDPPVGMAIPLLQRSYRPRVLSLNFDGGTPCDIESLNRSTQVRISCGDNDQILSVVEDHTCHYVMTVQSKQLCQVEGFRTPRKRIVPVELVSKADTDDFRSYLQHHVGPAEQEEEEE